MLESAKNGGNPLKVELRGNPKNSSTPIVVLSSGVFAPATPNGQATTNAEGIITVLSQLPIDVSSAFCFQDAGVSAPKTNLVVSPAAALVPPSAQRVFDIRQQGKYKIGFFGMVSMDWDVHSTNVLDDLPKEHKEFLVSEAKSSAKVLRTEYRVDLVVAVTNMRLAEDLLLSGATQEKGLERVDFIFGGYDREAVGTFYPELVMQSQHSEGESKGKVGSGRYEVTSPEIRVVKSGAAWEGLSVVEMCVKKEGEDLPELDSVKELSLRNGFSQEQVNGTRIEEHIRDEKNYTVAMTEWLASGWGGFSMLRKGQLLREGEAQGMTDTDLFFKAFGEWSDIDNAFISMATGNRKKKQAPVAVKKYLNNPYLSSRNSGLWAVRYKMVLGKDDEKGVPIVSPKLMEESISTKT
ncbi:uncharacterized protein PODANS_2_13795 [Podospora anserina S mat+]|uniref:Podospora anserina S mat+ genomic DNA chromosome 2, supercontig 3 n=1 Tax=Podospora anserina (strain S / ATCC MYA-4624 / DSM 980 / FGSC 10383) TaxID=515849 RepID=B2AC19_PODAN|nr:uncharacterized protein PODANS_2_13795 [Podospora anserina S mat+]CAP60980.1 unnamed protein product [Podospora anserina S mat+]CDP26447.1 Putative protein of unknown function [Podospora anserina S mat+]